MARSQSAIILPTDTMLISCLLLISANPQQLALDRFASFMKGAKALEVKVRASSNELRGEGSGTLVLAKPNRIRFEMKWLSQDYYFAANDRGTLEIEHTSKVYRQHTPFAGFVVPNSTLSWVPDYGYPEVLTLGDFRKLIPPQARIAKAEKQPPEGDAVQMVFGDGSGMTTIVAEIDPEGKLRSFVMDQRSPEGHLHVEQHFSGYVVNRAYDDSWFSLKLPLGYVPEVLPQDLWPVNVGETARLDGLVPLGETRTLDLRKHSGSRPLLVVLAAPDCDPSKAFVRELSGFAKEFRAKGGDIALVWENTPKAADSAGLPAFLDPGGSAMDRFRAPGTPLALLVHANGKVLQVWFGFDPERAGTLRRDLIAALDRARAAQ